MTTSTETLIKNLTEGKVAFSYRKLDGTLRAANGTLDVNLIPADKRPATINTNATAPSISYFDLDRNEWRAFRRGALV